jgi:hypothetical protein
MKVSLLVKDLKAVSLFTARTAYTDTRNLDVVRVEANIEHRTTRLVAIDGRTMGIIERPCTGNDVPEPFAISIPCWAVKQALSVIPKKMTEVVLCRNMVDDTTWALGNVIFEPVKRPFPNYRGVLVKETSGISATYNPELLIRFSKAAKILNGSSKYGAESLRVGQNGDEGCVILFNCDPAFYGILMPLRQVPFDWKTEIQKWIVADVDAYLEAKASKASPAKQG